MSAAPYSAHIDRVLGALNAKPVRSKTGEWLALCPAHADTRPSLAITQKPDGKLLVFCRSGGCEAQSVMSAVGLSLADLSPSLPADYTSPPRKSPAARPASPGRRTVSTYVYVDESGKTLFEVLRQNPKAFPQRRPDGNGGWIWNLDGVRRVLFRLPTLAPAVDAGKRIYIPEGEKDVLALCDRGLVATCNPGGAGKWEPGFSEQLRGARVVLLPDNDEAGRKHRDLLCTALRGIASEVRCVELPGLPAKGDVSDWLESGGTTEELVRLAEQAPPQGVVAGGWQGCVPMRTHVLPPFPIACLPTWLREYVFWLSDVMQTPSDMAGVLSLAVLATACAKVAEVRCGPDWHEPLNVFVVVAMPPASRKTGVVAKLVRPIEEFEAAGNAAGREQITDIQTQKDILHGRLQKAKADAVSGKSSESKRESEDLAARLAQDLDALTVPVAKRLLVDDCTPERLNSLISEQAGRIAVLSPEGDTFDLIAGRYSDDKSRLGVYLKGHAGDTLRVDRMADRRTEYVKRPALTLGLAVQPEVLRGLARKPELRGRGLLGRFLYSVPEPNIGSRRIDEGQIIPAEVTSGYRDGVARLLKLEPAKQDDESVPHILDLSIEACRVFINYRRRVEIDLGPDGLFTEMSDWGGKLCGAVARIMGLLHLAEFGSGGLKTPIMVRTACAAIQLGDYFAAHAKAAYAEMGADAESDNARYLLRWIQRGAESNRFEFSRRDAHYQLQGRFKRAQDLDKPLEILTERSFIREKSSEPTPSRGRKPSTLYEVNPALTQLTELTQMPTRRGSVEQAEEDESLIAAMLEEGDPFADTAEGSGGADV